MDFKWALDGDKGNLNVKTGNEHSQLNIYKQMYKSLILTDNWYRTDYAITYNLAIALLNSFINWIPVCWFNVNVFCLKGQCKV